MRARTSGLAAIASFVLTGIAAAAVVFTWPGSAATPATNEVGAIVERHSPCVAPAATCTSVEFALTSGPESGQLVAIEFDTSANEPLGRDALELGDVIRLRTTRAGAETASITYELISSERSVRVVGLLAGAIGGLAVIAGARPGRAVAALVGITTMTMLYTLPALDRLGDQTNSGNRVAIVVGSTIVLAAGALALADSRRPATHLVLTMTSTIGAASATLAANWLHLGDASYVFPVIGALSAAAVVGLRRTDATHLMSVMLIGVAISVPVLSMLATGSSAGLDDPSLATLAAIIASVSAGVLFHDVLSAALDRLNSTESPPAPAVIGLDEDFVIDLRPAVRREPATEVADPEPVPSLLGRLRAGLDD